MVYKVLKGLFSLNENLTMNTKSSSKWSNNKSSNLYRVYYSSGQFSWIIFMSETDVYSWTGLKLTL